MGFTDDDYKKILDLINLTQKPMVFILDGSLFKGNDVVIIKQYVTEKSDKKFRTWLIDKDLLIDDSFDENYIEPKSGRSPDYF